MSRLFSVLSLILAFNSLAAFPQTDSKSCPAPPAILASTQSNIFSEQQEQWLGDAMADMLEREYRPVHDPAETGSEPARTYNLIPEEIVFSFPLETDAGKELLTSKPGLSAQSELIKNKDAGRIIQVVNSVNGDVLHELVIEVPLTYEGVRGINVVGSNLYLSSEDNRTMVYSLSTGAQLRQFFGSVIALDAASERICTINRRDEAVVYDPDGNEVATFRTGSPLRFATFQRSGNRLILLTADQKVRTMEITSPTP